MKRCCAAPVLRARRSASGNDNRRAVTPGKEQTVTFRNGDGTRTVRSRWIVDASGVAAILARKEGWWKSNTEHPTAAAWSRWKGVKDWDSRELAEKYP